MKPKVITKKSYLKINLQTLSVIIEPRYRNIFKLIKQFEHYFKTNYTLMTKRKNI